MFSPSLFCLSIFPVVSFEAQTFSAFGLMKSSLLFFSLWILLLVSYLRIFRLKQGHREYLLFSAKTFSFSFYIYVSDPF